MTKRLMEGSRAVAEVIALCRPTVISAYPITPQTHIVQELAQMVADGELKVEYVNAESEHSAASVLLGASATGVRTYTATTSQGLLLMAEVLYNIAGMRLPVVMNCVNRAVSAPLNIWTDHQDSISVRDSGWIQLYAEDCQEAVDLMPQAYRIAEDHRIMLPLMVCMDGYVLSHAYEPVDVPSQGAVDSFLPPFQPIYRLDPDNPLTFGAYAEPDKYLETRYMLYRAEQKAIEVIGEMAQEFKKVFGRPSGGVIQTYLMEGASTAVVAMGSVVSAIKEAVDRLRARGERVGIVKVISYRPFPREHLYQALRKSQNIVVIEKAVSLGSGGPLATEVRALFQGQAETPRISGFIAGLGGRDIPVESIESAIAKARQKAREAEFLDLREDLELEGVS